MYTHIFRVPRAVEGHRRKEGATGLYLEPEVSNILRQRAASKPPSATMFRVNTNA